jgi:putative heme degradation protein
VPSKALSRWAKSEKLPQVVRGEAKRILKSRKADVARRKAVAKGIVAQLKGFATEGEIVKFLARRESGRPVGRTLREQMISRTLKAANA